MKKYKFEELWNRLPNDIREACEKCEQDPIYHPEGVVTQHIRMVFDYANTNYNGDVDLLLYALFHDLGKPETQTFKEKDGVLRISNKMHETKCFYYINKYFHLYSDISINKEKIIEICENHMKAHFYDSGTMKKQHKRQNFEKLKYFDDILKFLKCDENGRG